VTEKPGSWSHPVTDSKLSSTQWLTVTMSQPVTEAFSSRTLMLPLPLESTSTAVTSEVCPSELVEP
jgi:hypothetical protein